MEKNNEMIISSGENKENEPQELSEQELIQETVVCLEKTFTEKSNVERQKAERRLKELESNVLTHIRLILLGLGTDLKQDVKMAIVLYLKNTIRSRIESRAFTNEEVLQLLNIFCEVILTAGLNDQLIQNLSLSMTSIMNSAYVTQNPQILVGLSDLLIKFITKKQQESGLDTDLILSFKPVLILTQTIISSSGTNNENITDVLSKNIELILFIVNKVTEKLKSFTIKEDVPIYLSCINLIRLILDYLFLSLLKLKKLEMLDNTITIYINKFLFFAIESITYCNPSEMNLILFTGDKEIDNCLNSMKSKAFQFLSFIVQNEGNIIKNQVLIDNLSKLVSLAISSLTAVITEKMNYLSNMSKLSTDFPDNNYDVLLFQILLFLSRFLAREPIVTQFAAYIKNFVLSIVFPLLQSTKTENYMMHLEGEEYHNNLIDSILNHKAKSYKTSASFLLSKLCEKYDGLSFFIINFCYELIDFCMTGNNMETIGNYSILSLAKNPENVGIHTVLTTMTPENQIDISIYILLILNPNVNKNKRFLAMLRMILETHSDKIFSINSEMIRDKLCLLFGTFLDDLYSTDDVQGFYNHISKIFEFLFARILDYQNNQGSAYNASYSLCQLLYYKDFSQVVNSLIRKIMTNLIQIIKEIEVGLFFDVLCDIILYMDIEDSILPLCKEVTNRILKEIKSPGKMSKNKGLNVYISKCFHILRTVLEKNKMVIKSEERKDEVEVVIETDALELNQFEEIISPVVSYLKNPNKIDFDDEIVYLMINLIENARRITPLCKSVFLHFPQYIIKYEGITEELFNLLNLYIAYDDEQYLVNSYDALSNMSYIIKTGMEENQENEFSPIFASLLTQAWFECNKNIPQEYVVELVEVNVKEIQEIYGCYQDGIDQIESTFDVYTFSTFLTTIYSALVYYPYLTLNKLDGLGIFTDFIIWTELMLTFSFFSTYFSKILIIGICSILCDQNIINFLGADIVKRFLYIVFSLLLKQKNAETKRLKTALKDELECHFIASDEEENGNEEDDEDSGPVNIMELKRLNRKIEKMNSNAMYSTKEEKHIQKLINSIKTPLKESDEYQFFNRTLNNLNNSDSRIIPDLVSIFSDAQKFMWNELIHTRRVHIDHSGVKMDVPRRTVKIKRGTDTTNNNEMNNANSTSNL